MVQWLRRYALAAACIAAPFLFGFLPSSMTVAWLMAGSHVESIKLDYRLRDQPPQSEAKPEQKAEPGKTQTPADKREGKTDPAARLELVARHFSGLVSYALASGFLYFVVVAAFAVSAVMIFRRAGWQALALAIVFFSLIAAILTHLVMAHPERRLLVTDNIFQLTDRHDLLKAMPVTERMADLLAANIFVTMFTVGMLVSALAAASVLRGASVDLADLEDRLAVIRFTLFLASAVLVVGTLLAKALGDWPISLLAEAERKALDPAGDAITRLWGASGSIALVAAFLPGIAAWYLDRQAYRNAHLPADPAQQPADGLDIAPLSTVTSILVVLAPVVASPVFDALTSLVKAVNK